MVKIVFADVFLRSERSVNQAILVHKGELFKAVELFHSRLVGPKPLLAAKVGTVHKACGHIDFVDVVL